MIQYTTDRSLPDREWLVHPVLGASMITKLTRLTPNTVYWFRIEARNGAGTSPVSRAVRFRTSSGGPPRPRPAPSPCHPVSAAS